MSQRYRQAFWVGHEMAMVISGIAVVGFLFRLLPLLDSGSLGGFRGYDDGVHYAAGVHLLSGSLPYRDFVLVHPPGIAVIMLPFAALGQFVSDPVGVAAARVVFALIGALNVLLIGALLKKWGYAAIISGAGIYAVSSIATIAERSIMLSPLLTLCILAALFVLRRIDGGQDKPALTRAAVFLGFALTIKLWAILPIVVLTLMVGIRYGPRALMRFIGTGLLVCGLVMGPFFLASPGKMFNYIVQAQLARTDGEVKSVVDRLKDFVGIPLSPDWLIVISIVGVLIVFVSIGIGVSRRQWPREWKDEFWWGVLAVVTVTSVLVSMAFFDHYPNFSAAYLALCFGVSVGLATRVVPIPRWERPAVKVVAIAGTVALLVPVGVHGLVLEPKPLPQFDEKRLVSETAPYPCVFTPYAYLGIVSDSLTRSMLNGCGSTVDIYGSQLVESLAAGAPNVLGPVKNVSSDLQAQQLQGAQAAVVGMDLDTNGLSSLAITELKDGFVMQFTNGDFQVWVRR